MGKRAWKFKRVLRNRYGRQIWIVANRRGTKGFFKFPSSQNRKEIRILAANEYIASSLAKSVGLPAAKVQRAKVKGPKGMKRIGLVSVKAKAKKLTAWKRAPSKAIKEPEIYVKKAELLAQVIPFDAWIMNPDRTNHNLVLYRNKSSRLYKWYLIDHGIALFGKANKWRLQKARKRFKRKKQFQFSLLSKKGQWAGHSKRAETVFCKKCGCDGGDDHQDREPAESRHPKSDSFRTKRLLEEDAKTAP